MIKRVRLVRFKRFEQEIFDLSGQAVILAGPNNSGKTTLLQAISTWSLALSRWRLESGGTTGRTKRISVVLDEFTALPLREMNLLWLNRHVARRVAGAKTPKAAPIFIEATVEVAPGDEQSLAIELLYANEKLVYVRPVKSPEDPQPPPVLPSFAETFQVVHVPPFSGFGTQEPRHSVGIQSKLIGEGRAGEIVRNLVLEIWEASGRRVDASPWTDLSGKAARHPRPARGQARHCECGERLSSGTAASGLFLRQAVVSSSFGRTRCSPALHSPTGDLRPPQKCGSRAELQTDHRDTR